MKNGNTVEYLEKVWQKFKFNHKFSIFGVV